MAWNLQRYLAGLPVTRIGTAVLSRIRCKIDSRLVVIVSSALGPGVVPLRLPVRLLRAAVMVLAWGDPRRSPQPVACMASRPS